MGSFLFRWPHAANDVWVTGSFDDWGKTERLNRVGDVFEKEVQLPNADEKIYYKFVVDGNWTTDHEALKEDDGHHNVNNVLYPKDIKKRAAGSSNEPSAAANAGALGTGAAGGMAASSSSVPHTAERNTSPPGAFPETPADELEPAYGVRPLAATPGIGNPVSVPAGEKLPDHHGLTPHTVQSTVTTSQEDYEKDASAALPAAAGLGAAGVGGMGIASAFAQSEEKQNLIPESSLPMDAAATDSRDTGPHISSAAPTSTTAQLAAGVPLENKRQATVIDPDDAPGRAATETAPAVPAVVQESLSEAHQDPEAAQFPEAVQEKSAVERELLSKTTTSEATGDPAEAAAAQTSYYGLSTAVPAPVEQSMSQAHAAPEAASETAVVAEKRQVESELLAKVPSTDATGEPAPVLAAATSETAPTPTDTQGQNTAETATDLRDSKTPESQPSAATRGPEAGALAAGGLGAGAVAGTAALFSRHALASAESPETTAGRDTTTPTAAANPATSEIAKSDGAAPGIPSSAAGPVSEGVEDPSLADEPAFQAMDRSFPAETADIPSSTAATTGPSSAYHAVTSAAADDGPATTGLAAPQDHVSPPPPSGTGATGDARTEPDNALTSTDKAPLTDVEGGGKSDAIPSVASASTPSDVKAASSATADQGESAAATQKVLGPAAAGTTTTSKSATPTGSKQTTGNGGSEASTPSSSAAKDKKKKHRISGFFKKIFD